jgi:hypothetical protein
MAYRFVSKSEDVRTAADAEAYVVSDTGGVVIPTGNTTATERGWQIECFSTGFKPIPYRSRNETGWTPGVATDLSNHKPSL